MVVVETMSALGIAAVKAIITAHATAITASALRGPIRPPQTPPGNWNSA
jgi:hypothetical protein